MPTASTQDYPRTLLEFEKRFHTEDDCRAYLEALRWPEGFACPRCNAHDCWRTERGLLKCRTCAHQTSLIAGTSIEGTHLPLHLWFRAAWWMTTQKTGLSAKSLQRALGLGSYRTAWLMLHRLREAMVRPQRSKLHDRIEVGVRCFCKKGWTCTEGDRLVAIAVEEDGRGVGRVRMRKIKSESAEEMLAFIGEFVEPGSTIHTVEKSCYAKLTELGYQHEASAVQELRAVEALRRFPRVHLIATLVKRWLNGTYQGRYDAVHLDQYLEEFSFRFNRRRAQHAGKIFYRLMQSVVGGYVSSS